MDDLPPPKKAKLVQESGQVSPDYHAEAGPSCSVLPGPSNGEVLPGTSNGDVQEAGPSNNHGKDSFF